ncbi:putative transglutaminase-like cysteine proteinase [Nonomuraea thailandensis]|uniref:Transglutaminase-like cysteine proteinase n=1 Tax=Nonomuraea thailandensis TaxID=1188745 RepID=A0A9X2K919_9ACTN|nr:hypothetical protein [Nonomuraea thailandensis]MCP2365257.1 putative transglutaminase-like cysteine proteinase [Nonomuraea thailandensis]
MFKSLAATALVAAAATTLMAAPAEAATSSAQLIRTKSSWGHCENTCRVKVRITNISRKNLFNVKLTVTLKVNGRKVGSCYDNVGRVNARKVRYAACTVRTAKLSEAWNDHIDGYGDFRTYARTSVAYKYYR